jgi:hypothetical protein
VLLLQRQGKAVDDGALGVGGACVHACVYVCVRVCVCVRLRMHVCVWVSVRVRTHVCERSMAQTP